MKTALFSLTDSDETRNWEWNQMIVSCLYAHLSDVSQVTAKIWMHFAFLLERFIFTTGYKQACLWLWHFTWGWDYLYKRYMFLFFTDIWREFETLRLEVLHVQDKQKCYTAFFSLTSSSFVILCLSTTGEMKSLLLTLLRNCLIGLLSGNFKRSWAPISDI